MEFSVACISNDPKVLNDNLLASPCIADGKVSDLAISADHPNAGVGLNRMIDQTKHSVVIIAHQDVYLPAGFEQRLAAEIERISAIDPDWGILAPIGLDVDGQTVGRVWDSGLVMEIDWGAASREALQSADELLLVLNKRSGLRFDEALPSFHLYATDIITSGRAQGVHSYLVDTPVIHNSLRVVTLLGGYGQSYRYMQKKWRHELPIQTTVVPISRFGLSLYWLQLRFAMKYSKGSQEAEDRSRYSARVDPASKSRELGYGFSAAH